MRKSPLPLLPDPSAESSCESFAFCSNSTGVFLLPPRRAAQIGAGAVHAWLRETGSRMKAVFNVLRDLDREMDERRLNGEA